MNSIADLCSDFITSKKLKDESERNIIEFAEAPWGLGMGTSPDLPPLFPVQKFIFKCAYNIPLLGTGRNIIIKDRFNEKERFRFTELEYLKFLQDEHRINIKEVTGNPEDIRPNICLVIGRRGTKTTTIGVLIAYEVYKLLKKFSPHQYYNSMPNEDICLSCIATNQEQASELFRRITGHLERADFFKRYREKPTLNYMQLNTERDIEEFGPGQRPSIRLVAAPCSGRGLRGRNNLIAVFDEMAYFFESSTSADKSDEEVYKAVTPSVAKFNSPEGEPHGKVICISSPNTRSGLFYKLYQRSFEEDCNDLLMIQAPTWEVDYTLAPKYLRAKYAENPIAFKNEFGAEFNDRIFAWIENEQVLRMNIIPGLKMKESSLERLPHFMGVDVGLQNDGTAIVICHIVKKETPSGWRDFIELDCAEVRYAKDEKKDFFSPEEIGDWIATFAEKFFIVQGTLDQHYGLAIVPQLHNKGFKQIQVTHASREYNSKIFQNLMSKMLDASLRIPEGSAERFQEGLRTKDIPLVSELLILRATQHSKYLISVEAPEIKGSHDDLSDAFARAVYLATEYMSNGGGTVKSNTVQSSSTSSMSYKQYFRKSKMSSMYTKRPSSGIMSEMARARSYGATNIRGSGR
jgi:hypothetical protein